MTTSRLQRIVALLETKDDYLPAAQTQRLATQSGPAAGSRVPCPCTRLTARGLEADNRCLHCNGTGWRTRLNLDPDDTDTRGIILDEYTYEHDLQEHALRARTFGTPTARVMTLRELDQEIARLHRLEAVRKGVIKHERYGWETERRQRDRNGSYRELDAALERLRDQDPEAYELVVHAHVEHRYGTPPELSKFTQTIVDRGLTTIACLMPDRIALPDQLEQQLTADQKRARIADLLAEGWKTSRIARELRLTQETVKREARRRHRADRPRSAGAPVRAA